MIPFIHVYIYILYDQKYVFSDTIPPFIIDTRSTQQIFVAAQVVTSSSKELGLCSVQWHSGGHEVGSCRAVRTSYSCCQLEHVQTTWYMVFKQLKSEDLIYVYWESVWGIAWDDLGYDHRYGKLLIYWIYIYIHTRVYVYIYIYIHTGYVCMYIYIYIHTGYIVILQP